jgi:class 3 adenylate cyclase
MTATPVKRKLAAILAADAVGYSRMMAADEEGTMKILSAHRSVIDGIIQFHEGRIINTAGDSVLAEFASPTQAVRCAVEIQDALKTRNDSLPEERRLHFRIGVNLGDVMVKGEDLLGDGVNVAARLEGIAEPGEICLSSSVYDQIAGKLDLGFVDMGEQSLKNIDRPIRAYRVERSGTRGRAAARKARAAPGAWPWALAAGIALAAGAGWLALQPSGERRNEQAQAAAAAELARARAEAEAAKKSAAAATASAEAAKRALEELRVAETRARAQAELSAARAEAEATRRKAEAELASATAARRKAETAAAAPPAPAPAALAPAMAKWAGTMACGGVREAPPAAFALTAVALGDAFELGMGTPGQPGSAQLKGTRLADQSMQVAGSGISGSKSVRGQSFPASFDGKFSDGRYLARGKLGGRDCALALLPEAEFVRVEAARARAHPGPWTGMLACAAIGRAPPAAFPITVSAAAGKFQLSNGEVGKPGSLRLSGARQADGRMSLAGGGMSAVKEYLGNPYTATFDGRFSGGRYRGRGVLGRRDCGLTIDPR